MKLGIVVPCYNEEEVLPETANRLQAILEELTKAGKLDASSKIYFVDDGSQDRTWETIEALVHTRQRFAGIKLSRNEGHQNALLAGLLTSEGDALVSMDADLQDDITVIEKMVDAHRSGFHVVYGVRKSRDSDTLLKRGAAQLYYKLLRWAGGNVLYNHADFRLMSRQAIDCLRQFSEVNLFLRGIVPLIGLTHTVIYYDRLDRFAGKSKYPLRKMLALATDGITSFSTVPLRVIAVVGIVISLISLFMTLWVLWVRLFTDRAVPGWASSVIPIYFLGGIQLLSMGVLGEYVAKIYFESKRRPRYFIEKVI